MPGIPSLRSPFRNRRFFSSNSRSDTASSTALPTLPPQAVEADQDVSESSVNAVDRVNVEQLRAALCAFLGIEEGRENAEFLNRYIQTFCAASAIMGDSNTLNNILGQSEDEFHNTLEICRLISEQFEIEISAQHQRQQLMESTTQSAETTETNLPPASERTIESLPFERILPADQANFQHDKTCCPICVEPLIDGLVLTRLPCGHLYHQNCALVWLSRSGSCPECRYELPTDMGPEYERDRCARMDQLQYNLVSCSCEHHSMGVHTCFFRDRKKLLSEQVTTDQRNIRELQRAMATVRHDQAINDSLSKVELASD